MPFKVSVDARSYPEVEPFVFTLTISPEAPTSQPLPPPPPPPPVLFLHAPTERTTPRLSMTIFIRVLQRDKVGRLARGQDATGASVARVGLSHPVAFLRSNCSQVADL